MRIPAISAIFILALLVFGCASQPAANNTAQNVSKPGENITPAPPVRNCSGTVCGVDGKTYDSDCMAADAGVAPLHAGACAVCDDSDDGLEQGAGTGVVTFGSQSYADRCADSNTLIEYVCTDNKPINVTIPCGAGKECKDGGCVQITNATTPPPPPPAAGCTGPIAADIFTRQSVRFNNTLYNDSCVDFKTVKDYFCQADTVKSENHECDPGYGCMNGQCVKQVPICTDSDGGNNTLVKGTTVVIKGLTKMFDQTDSCVDSGTITESYCTPDGMAETQDVLCPSGTKCANGQCVQSRCSETDGGIDIYQAGTVTSGENTATDTCIDDHNIVEYYCYGDEIRDQHLSCGVGYLCDADNDKCVESSTSRTIS